MSLFPIDLPPGVLRNGTMLQSLGRYWAADLVRWIDGCLKPIGGWRQRADGPVHGRARAMIVWRDDDGVAWVAIGTHTGLWIMDRAGNTYDITPVRATAALTDPFTTTDASDIVTVADVAHGASVGHRVVFSGATAVGGLTIDGTYDVVSVVDPDSYTITAASAATSAANGGGAVSAKYQIAPGEASSTFRGGYGNGLYGRGAYGTARPDTQTPTELTVPSVDTWGENLVYCTVDNGTIFEWLLNTASAAVAVSGAPTCRAVHVTADRIMIALGANGNPRRVAWSDQEDNTTWTPAVENYAGDFDLQTPGRLMCGRKVTGGTLLLTDVDAHLATFDGQPLVYVFKRVGTGCGIVSQNAVAVVDGRAFWMGPRGFWSYNNWVEALPCDVADYVFSDINRSQIQKATAWHNTDYGEVWWFYPSKSSTEIDRYVVYSYREGHWTIGSSLQRLSGTERGPLAFPLTVDVDGVIHENEVGLAYDGNEPWAETAPFQVGEGDHVIRVRQIIPDERTSGDVTVTVYLRNRPMGEEITKGPFVLDDKVDVRFTGRLMRVRFTGARLSDWRVGHFKLEGVPGGIR